MKKWKWPGMLLLALVLCLSPVRVNAESIDDASVYRNPHIVFTPDGKAYTTDFMEKDYESVRKGEVIETGEVSALPELQEGQHKYSVKKTGLLHIEKWVADYTPGRCIHNEYWHNEQYHDLTVSHNNCLQYYKNGWLGYCADCHQKIDILFYMDRETARTLTTLPLEMEYFYMCPNCDNLEQARELRHECEDISWNKYTVKYNANALSARGYMATSTLMYNNETMYDGKRITPETRLRKNRFVREGYEFVGWNTKSDGSGESFTDGQEVYNLTSVDNGEIILYAQWKKSESTLHIHPGSGKLDGASGIVSVTKKYAATENVSADRLTPPKGAVITFNTNGGSAVADMETTRYFEEWSLSYPFHGELADEVYHFTGPDGSEDAITAVYGHRPITLPDTQKPTLEFGGWYKDPECTQLVGPAGAEVIITQNTTLYAQWVSLQLTATEDYTVYGGSGAVDLSWVNAENTQMTYQVYQMREGGSWTKYENVLAEKTSVEETFSYTGNRGTYTVPYSGLYTLTLTGSQGGSYNVVENGVLQKVMPGGKGGQVKATAFLHAGEILTYNIGSTSGYNGGGTGSIFANGGGMTILSSNTKGTLVVAGGGGGASVLLAGGPGGAQTSLTADSNGGSGAVGGGGGYLGGNAGEAVYHVHDDEVCNYHEHVGDETAGGDCYSGDLCGGTDFQRVGGDLWYWSPHWGGGGVCVQCGYNFGLYGNESQAHAAYTPVEYVCRACDARYGNQPASCSAGSGYTLSCTIPEGYNCGKSDKTVESAKTAYGGSNYVQNTFCTQLSNESGVGIGNGSINLYLESVECVDGLELSDVVAKDMAAPNVVSAFNKVAAGDGLVKISWKEPADNGTVYYHQVAAHELAKGTEVCRSNIAENTLTSGVSGYYFIIDKNESTKVTASSGSYTTQNFVEVGALEEIQYLHVAAVDMAGNISESVHLEVDINDPLITWPIYTKQISISATQDNIYPYGDKTWYVRADGKTSFIASYNSYMNHKALKDYQINYGIFQMENDGMKQIFKIYVPSREITTESYAYGANELQRGSEGWEILQDGVYTRMVRSNECKNLDVAQGFVMAPENDGKEVVLYPTAGVVMKNGKTRYSDYETDYNNRVTLIADGAIPLVDGLDKLEHFEELDRTTDEAIVEITASDYGSGLRELYAVIQSKEDYVTRTVDAVGGLLTLDFTDIDDVMFNGSFSVTVYAVDNVGNAAKHEFGLQGFSLTTEIERVLPPHEPIFKCGESGVLKISTTGYVDKLVIDFPPLLDQYDAVIDYAVPSLETSESIMFTFPLYVPDWTYTVVVTAYKNGIALKSSPQLITMADDGSGKIDTILNEFRVRIR